MTAEEAISEIKRGICCICGTGANSDMKCCDNCGQALDWHEELNKNV